MLSLTRLVYIAGRERIEAIVKKALSKTRDVLVSSQSNKPREAIELTSSIIEQTSSLGDVELCQANIGKEISKDEMVFRMCSIAEVAPNMCFSGSIGTSSIPLSPRADNS